MHFGIPGHLPGEVPDPGLPSRRICDREWEAIPGSTKFVPSVHRHPQREPQRMSERKSQRPTLIGAFRTFLPVQALPAALPKRPARGKPCGARFRQPGSASPVPARSAWSSIYSTTPSLATNLAGNLATDLVGTSNHGATWPSAWPRAWPPPLPGQIGSGNVPPWVIRSPDHQAHQ